MRKKHNLSKFGHPDPKVSHAAVVQQPQTDLLLDCSHHVVCCWRDMQGKFGATKQGKFRSRRHQASCVCKHCQGSESFAVTEGVYVWQRW